MTHKAAVSPTHVTAGDAPNIPTDSLPSPAATIFLAASVLFRSPPQSMGQSSARSNQHDITIDLIHQVVTVTDKRTRVTFCSPMSNVVEYRL